MALITPTGSTTLNWMRVPDLKVFIGRLDEPTLQAISGSRQPGMEFNRYEESLYQLTLRAVEEGGRVVVATPDEIEEYEGAAEDLLLVGVAVDREVVTFRLKGRRWTLVNPSIEQIMHEIRLDSID